MSVGARGASTVYIETLRKIRFTNFYDIIRKDAPLERIFANVSTLMARWWECNDVCTCGTRKTKIDILAQEQNQEI